VTRLRVAVVGGGRIAREHLRVLTAHPECDVVVLCDRDEAVQRSVADQFRIPERTTSAAALAGRDDLDAVFVMVSLLAAPAVISLFLEAGMPTFLEKPPGLYTADTARLVELAERRGTLAMVGLNRRFYSHHLVVRDYFAAEGPHGPLATVTVEAHEDLANTPAKHPPEVVPRVLYHNSIHAIDLLRFFGGEVADVESHVARVEHAFPDSFAAVVRFASGARGCLLSDHFASGGHRFELRGIGARATSQPGFAATELAVRGAAPRLIAADEDDVRFKAGLWKQDSAFLAGVRAGRQPPFPAASLPDAYHTMQLIDRIATPARGA
jgi:predicted dehydrogenase